MTPQFELNLTYRNGKELVSFDKIEAEDLVSLLSQFIIVIANVQRKIVERIEAETGRSIDDDVPF